jgi:hypothetical protein
MKPLADAPLLDALIGRRSRRFAPGFRLNGGPLAFESQRPANPLSLDEGGGRFRNCPSTPGASRPAGAGTSWCTSSAAPGPAGTPCNCQDALTERHHQHVTRWHWHCGGGPTGGRNV